MKRDKSISYPVFKKSNPSLDPEANKEKMGQNVRLKREFSNSFLMT